MLESNGWSFRNRLVRKKLGLTLVSEKTHGLSTPVAAPPALITLPGRSYSDSDLTVVRTTLKKIRGLYRCPDQTWSSSKERYGYSTNLQASKDRDAVRQGAD